MSITKITTPELLDFPNDSTSSANTSGTVIPTGYTNACNFPTFSSGVALYQFENNNADDTCGNYNLTEVGSPSYVTGNFGEAIQFNGTSQGLTSTSAVIPNGPATISLWFNGNSTATAEFYIIGVGVGGSAYGLDIHYFNSSFWAGVVDGGSFQGVGGGVTTVNTSTWYHLALTWDGSTNADSMKLYLNGALETNITPLVTASSLTYSSFGICHFSGTSTYAPGIVDQVRIFNSVLTPTQITELYNETTTEEYRPTTSLNAGEFRFNTTAGYVEYYDGSNWQQIADEYITGQPTTCICSYPTSAVALYQFEDNANDTCGNYNGTAYNLNSYVTGKFGKAASFNGSSSYITVGNVIPNTDTDVTISAWVKLSSGVSSNMNITGTGITTGLSEAPFRATLSYQSANTFKIFALRQVGGTYYYAGTGGLNDVTINAGTWYHVVWSYNSTGRELSTFLNGIAIDTGVAMSTSGGSINDSSTAIGSFRSSSGPFFDGEIDQLRIFSSKLTSIQVTELYNEVVCN